MGLSHRDLQFRTGEPAEIVDALDEVLQQRDGRSWVTMSPWIAPENLPVTSVLRRLLSARGPKIPEVTVVPAFDGERAQLGVLHAQGPGALRSLAEDGVQLPEGFEPTQDHSRNGALFALPDSPDPATVLQFAVLLGSRLAAVPTDDRWVARLSTRD